MTNTAVPPRILWISSIASICVFLAISSVLIVSGTGPLPPDRYVYRHFSIGDDDVVDLIVLVTDIGDPVAMAILTASFGIYLVLRKDRQNAVILMGGMLLVFLMDVSMKLAFHRLRPGSDAIHAAGAKIGGSPLVTLDEALLARTKNALDLADAIDYLELLSNEDQ